MGGRLLRQVGRDMSQCPPPLINPWAGAGNVQGKGQDRGQGRDRALGEGWSIVYDGSPDSKGRDMAESTAEGRETEDQI